MTQRFNLSFLLCSFLPFLPSFMIFLFIFRNGSFSIFPLMLHLLCINHISVFSFTRLLNPSWGRENEFVSVRRKCLRFKYLDQALLPVFWTYWTSYLVVVLRTCFVPVMKPLPRSQCEFSEKLLTLNISLYLLRMIQNNSFLQDQTLPCSYQPIPWE